MILDSVFLTLVPLSTDPLLQQVLYEIFRINQVAINSSNVFSYMGIITLGV